MSVKIKRIAPAILDDTTKTGIKYINKAFVNMLLMKGHSENHIVTFLLTQHTNTKRHIKCSNSYYLKPSIKNIVGNLIPTSQLQDEVGFNLKFSIQKTAANNQRDHQSIEKHNKLSSCLDLQWKK